MMARYRPLNAHAISNFFHGIYDRDRDCMEFRLIYGIISSEFICDGLTDGSIISDPKAVMYLMIID
jgi:hypothetical protein